MAGADLQLPASASSPGTPGVTSTPHPEPPTASTCTGTSRLPPRCLSPVMPVPHRELPAPEIPPDALAVTADLHHLTQRVAGEDRGEASAGYRLPPLLAALTRRTEDDARLQQLRCLRLPLRGGVGEEEPAGAPRPRRDPAPQPAEPYEKGLWKPVLPELVPVGLERLQRRLHRLWATLGVPSRERMEMAVKYGTGGVLARLPAALDAWEAVAGGILRRELLLARLERLEERGSDPTRFFHAGPASATARAEETRARGRLRATLARCEARLSAALRHLWDDFGDTATFRGRPYAEKMRWDAVEMLYWLQQRRRAGALQAALGVQPQRHPPGTAGAETSGCQ
ncbi:coiled-coil domain-containing protein 87 isoform X2 [Grus americana]|uniref:coiled-coil domain-containing protein 87 isoform X2 n=1 Tax=Grus americana TaxID=9117 RepID=UPI002407EFBF|nr:coiled-coil domain-containing protein 87 isoform X2 [Grus americana]